MKFNFKRIASVLTGAVMLSSTVAFAAAANFPAPFTNGYAVVYGSNAAVAATDITKAQEIATKISQSQLASATTTTTTTVVSGDGDQITLEKSSTKLHLGSVLSSAFTKTITDSDLPELLMDGTFQNNDNDDFDYVQEVVVSPDLLPKLISHSDLNDKDPTVGVQLVNNQPILNYTLDFTELPAFNSTMATSTIDMMGKEYYVLEADSESNMLTLLDSASTVVVPEGETKTITVDGVSYAISVRVSSATQMRVTVNGKTSNLLEEGDTYKISDNVYLGVKAVDYNSKESGVSGAEVSIGSGKLELVNGQKVQMNEENVDGLKAYLGESSGKLDYITLAWSADDDMFITENSSIEMPGFKALKLSTTGLMVDSEEETTVEPHGESMELNTVIKNSDISIDILHFSSSGVIDAIGSDTDGILRTSGTTSITYDDTNDDYFVASYANGEESESYLLRATSFSSENNDATNYTTIEQMSDGSWTSVQKVTEGDEVSLGNIELTIGDINSDDDEVTLTATSSNTNFRSLYTASGLKVFLPYDSVAAGTDGRINLTASPKSYVLRFSEEDEDGYVAAGNNFTLNLTANSDNDPTVVSVLSGTNGSAEIGDSDKFLSRVYSALATSVLHDTGGDQDSVSITYYGEEVPFKLLLTAPDVTTSSSNGGSGSTNTMVVTDAEMSKYENMNLVVVGGSCINTVAQKLLGADAALCAADFTAKTGVNAGEYLVKTYESPYNSAKVATLVAGYNAADTVNAADFLVNEEVDTTVDTAYKNGAKLSVSA